MMLVLPAQAIASAAGLGCAFSHQGQAAHMGVEQRAMTDAAMAVCDEPGQPASSSAAHDCKHCSACYFVSALLMPAVDAPSLPFVMYSVIPHADDAFTGFIPDSPERPPRILFA